MPKNCGQGQLNRLAERNAASGGNHRAAPQGAAGAPAMEAARHGALIFMPNSSGDWYSMLPATSLLALVALVCL